MWGSWPEGEARKRGKQNRKRGKQNRMESEGERQRHTERGREIEIEIDHRYKLSSWIQICLKLTIQLQSQ